MKDAGETGRKRAGRRCRPWMAATATVAHYPIHPRRPRQGLRGLLGEVIRGMIRGDRRSADGELPVEARIAPAPESARSAPGPDPMPDG